MKSVDFLWCKRWNIIFSSLSLSTLPHFCCLSHTRHSLLNDFFLCPFLCFIIFLVFPTQQFPVNLCCSLPVQLQAGVGSFPAHLMAEPRAPQHRPSNAIPTITGSSGRAVQLSQPWLAGAGGARALPLTDALGPGISPPGQWTVQLLLWAGLQLLSWKCISSSRFTCKQFQVSGDVGALRLKTAQQIVTKGNGRNFYRNDRIEICSKPFKVM